MRLQIFPHFFSTPQNDNGALLLAATQTPADPSQKLGDPDQFSQGEKWRRFFQVQKRPLQEPFPAPVEEEKFQKYREIEEQRIKNGLRDQLYRAYLFLVPAVVEFSKVRRESKDDASQTVELALLEAIDDFIPSGERRFSDFAFAKMMQAIRGGKDDKRGRDVSLEAKVGPEDDRTQGDFIAGDVPDAQEGLLQEQERREISAQYDTLIQEADVGLKDVPAPIASAVHEFLTRRGDLTSLSEVAARFGAPLQLVVDAVWRIAASTRTVSKPASRAQKIPTPLKLNSKLGDVRAGVQIVTEPAGKKLPSYEYYRASLRERSLELLKTGLHQETAARLLRDWEEWKKEFGSDDPRVTRSTDELITIFLPDYALCAVAHFGRESPIHLAYGEGIFCEARESFERDVAKTSEETWLQARFLLIRFLSSQPGRRGEGIREEAFPEPLYPAEKIKAFLGDGVYRDFRLYLLHELGSRRLPPHEKSYHYSRVLNLLWVYVDGLMHNQKPAIPFNADVYRQAVVRDFGETYSREVQEVFLGFFREDLVWEETKGIRELDWEPLAIDLSNGKKGELPPDTWPDYLLRSLGNPTLAEAGRWLDQMGVGIQSGTILYYWGYSPPADWRLLNSLLSFLQAEKAAGSLPSITPMDPYEALRRAYPADQCPFDLDEKGRPVVFVPQIAFDQTHLSLAALLYRYLDAERGTYEDLAKSWGVVPETVRLYSTGHLQKMHLRNLDRLAQAMASSADQEKRIRSYLFFLRYKGYFDANGPVVLMPDPEPLKKLEKRKRIEFEKEPIASVLSGVWDELFRILEAQVEKLEIEKTASVLMPCSPQFRTFLLHYLFHGEEQKRPSVVDSLEVSIHDLQTIVTELRREHLEYSFRLRRWFEGEEIVSLADRKALIHFYRMTLKLMGEPVLMGPKGAARKGTFRLPSGFAHPDMGEGAPSTPTPETLADQVFGEYLRAWWQRSGVGFVEKMEWDEDLARELVQQKLPELKDGHEGIIQFVHALVEGFNRRSPLLAGVPEIPGTALASLELVRTGLALLEDWNLLPADDPSSPLIQEWIRNPDASPIRHFLLSDYFGRIWKILQAHRDCMVMVLDEQGELLTRGREFKNRTDFCAEVLMGVSLREGGQIPDGVLKNIEAYLKKEIQALEALGLSQDLATTLEIRLGEIDRHAEEKRAEVERHRRAKEEEGIARNRVAEEERLAGERARLEREQAAAAERTKKEDAARQEKEREEKTARARGERIKVNVARLPLNIPISSERLEQFPELEIVELDRIPALLLDVLGEWFDLKRPPEEAERVLENLLSEKARDFIQWVGMVRSLSERGVAEGPLGEKLETLLLEVGERMVNGDLEEATATAFSGYTALREEVWGQIPALERIGLFPEIRQGGLEQLIHFISRRPLPASFDDTWDREKIAEWYIRERQNIAELNELEIPKDLLGELVRLVNEEFPELHCVSEGPGSDFLAKIKLFAEYLRSRGKVFRELGHLTEAIGRLERRIKSRALLGWSAPHLLAWGHQEALRIYQSFHPALEKFVGKHLSVYADLVGSLPEMKALSPGAFPFYDTPEAMPAGLREAAGIANWLLKAPTEDSHRKSIQGFLETANALSRNRKKADQIIDLFIQDVLAYYGNHRDEILKDKQRETGFTLDEDKRESWVSSYPELQGILPTEVRQQRETYLGSMKVQMPPETFAYYDQLRSDLHDRVNRLVAWSVPIAENPDPFRVATLLGKVGIEAGLARDLLYEWNLRDCAAIRKTIDFGLLVERLPEITFLSSRPISEVEKEFVGAVPWIARAVALSSDEALKKEFRDLVLTDSLSEEEIARWYFIHRAQILTFPFSSDVTVAPNLREMMDQIEGLPEIRRVPDYLEEDMKWKPPLVIDRKSLLRVRVCGMVAQMVGNGGPPAIFEEILRAFAKGLPNNSVSEALEIYWKRRDQILIHSSRWPSVSEELIERTMKEEAIQAVSGAKIEGCISAFRQSKKPIAFEESNPQDRLAVSILVFVQQRSENQTKELLRKMTSFNFSKTACLHLAVEFYWKVMYE